MSEEIKMTVSVDGLRSNLAQDYNALVRTLRNLVNEEDIQDASVYGDAFEEIEEKLQELRQSVGILLYIYDDAQDIHILRDEIDRLENATITKQEEADTDE